MNKLLLLFAAAPLFVYGQDQPSVRFAALVTAAEMEKDLRVLASDEYEGRETGQKGQKMAAEYIANSFKLAGIPPVKDSTYYQQFPLNVILPSPASIVINKKTFVSEKDYFYFPGIAKRELNVTEVLFMGYGISEQRYDDYKNVDAKGKVVVLMAGEPFQDSISLVTGNTKPSTWSTYYKAKPERARSAGAAACLIVTGDMSRAVSDFRHKLQSPAMKLEIREDEMPVFYISTQMAETILGKTVGEITKPIITSGKPASAPIPCKLRLKIENQVQQITSENVLGFIEGSDLKDELLVVTAHYDHLGKDGNVVYNGADDDGSGTVAIMAMARAFAAAKKEGHGPRRSILFMAVAGEEKGLLGSSYYTDHPIIPLEKTVCDLNIDMIGRIDEAHKGNPDYIYIIGADRISQTLHDINESMNKQFSNLQLDYTYNSENDRNRYYYRSDHYNFASKGIPVIFYFNGVHADYHQESDEVDKINFQKMEKIARLVFHTAWEVANRSERLPIDAKKKN